MKMFEPSISNKTSVNLGIRSIRIDSTDMGPSDLPFADLFYLHYSKLGLNKKPNKVEALQKTISSQCLLGIGDSPRFNLQLLKSYSIFN